MAASTVTYLSQDELYRTEKPFATELKFEGPGEIPSTNYLLSKQPVIIRQIGPSDCHDIDIHGFCVMQADIALDADDALHRPTTVEAAYTRELATFLTKKLPQYTRIEPIDFVVSLNHKPSHIWLAAYDLKVRKRDPRFPSDQYGQVSHQQPTAIAHADYTTKGAVMQLHYSFPGQETYFRDREYDIIK
jgi:hypothetical protein